MCESQRSCCVLQAAGRLVVGSGGDGIFPLDHRDGGVVDGTAGGRPVCDLGVDFGVVGDAVLCIQGRR